MRPVRSTRKLPNSRWIVMHPGGTQIGEVAGILFDKEGRASKLRMRREAMLGLGERTIELPKHSFMLLRGTVVVDLSVEAVQAWPDVVESSEK